MRQLLLLCLLATGAPAWADSIPQPTAPVEDLVERLRGEESGGRLAAAQQLAWEPNCELGYTGMGTCWWSGDPAAQAATQALVAALEDPYEPVRRTAVCALGLSGRLGVSEVSALATRLDDPSQFVRRNAVLALGQARLPLDRYLPLLLRALDDEAEGVHRAAETALGHLGERLSSKGVVLAWVVPYVYRKQLVALLLALGIWFAVMGRFPRHRPTKRLGHGGQILLTAGVAFALAGPAVGYAVTRPWAAGFLPEGMTFVPFTVAALLSSALACALPAAWVCLRKTASNAHDAPATVRA